MATYFHGNSEIQSAASGPDGLQTLVLMNPTGYIPYTDTPPPPSSSASGNLVFLNSTAAALAHHHAPSHQQAQHYAGAAAGGDFAAAFHHGFLPQRVHYNLWTPPAETPSPSARDTPRASTPLQQGLSLTLSSQQLGFGSPHAPPSGDDARVVSGGSSAVSGVTNGGGGGAAGIQSVLLSSKYLKAAQELLEEVVNVGAGIGAEAAGKKGSKAAVGESSGAAASGEGSGGEGSGKRAAAAVAAELTPAERQEVQMKKAKLISMLDEVEQRYRQYHHQMQIVISSFEQAAGMGSARTYTALALQTISKQFRCLKDAIAGQIRAASRSLGEEEKAEGSGGGSSRLKFVDHHLRQQRALHQLGMIQQNAWRPQRGLPERSVSVLRAWLFEHFLHPYPKDSDKHMLAKQTGLTRSQVSNWFINARVRLWKPMVEEMYLEEIKEQEQNGAGEKAAANDNDRDSNASKSKDKSSPTALDDDNIPLAVVGPGMSMSMSTPSPSPTGRAGGFSLVSGSSELDGIAHGNSPKKARCGDGNMLLRQSPSSHVSVDVKPGRLNSNVDVDDDDNNNQISIGRDGYSFMGGQTNFIGGFGQYPIAEIGRPFDSDQHHFTARYAGNNGVSLTLGLPHCDTQQQHHQIHHHLSLAGGAHPGFVPAAGHAIQLGGGRRVVDHHHHHHHIAEVADHQFGAINASPHPHSSSAAAAAFDAINIQNPKRFAAQLLPDFVS